MDFLLITISVVLSLMDDLCVTFAGVRFHEFLFLPCWLCGLSLIDFRFFCLRGFSIDNDLGCFVA